MRISDLEHLTSADKQNVEGGSTVFVNAPTNTAFFESYNFESYNFELTEVNQQAVSSSYASSAIGDANSYSSAYNSANIDNSSFPFFY